LRHQLSVLRQRGAFEAEADAGGPTALRLALSPVSRRGWTLSPLSSQKTVIRWHRNGLSTVLALESRAPRGGRPRIPEGDPPPDPGDEPGEPACGAHPRIHGELLEARKSEGRTVDGCQVHGEEWARGGHRRGKTFSAQPCGRHWARWTSWFVAHGRLFGFSLFLVILRHERRLISSVTAPSDGRSGSPIRSPMPSLGMKHQTI